MTTLKEISEINQLVTNEEQARRASRMKWDRISEILSRLETWIGRQCGFCALGAFRAEMNDEPRAKRCDYCPSDVKALCETLDGKISAQIDELDLSIQSVIQFLETDFKVTDGSAEEKTDV